VEDQNGHLLGLLSFRSLLRLMARGQTQTSVPVREIMTREPITIRPEASIYEAMKLMRERDIGCLPVVNAEGRLVGILTEHDFMDLSAALLERWLQED
jgi:CBS domain-containing protein